MRSTQIASDNISFLLVVLPFLSSYRFNGLFNTRSGESLLLRFVNSNEYHPLLIVSLPPPPKKQSIYTSPCFFLFVFLLLYLPLLRQYWEKTSLIIIAFLSFHLIIKSKCLICSLRPIALKAFYNETWAFDFFANTKASNIDDIAR